MDTIDQRDTVDLITASNDDGGNDSSADAVRSSMSANVSANQSSQTATIVVNPAPPAMGSLTANPEELILPLTLRERPRVQW